MRRTIVLAFLSFLLCAPAVAVTGTDPHGTRPDPHGAVGEKLEAGSNSFTEAQVKRKFEEMGFGEVTDLHKDEQGIWRGKAMHAGKQLSIGMDYQGNVAAE